jgi:DNA invertase Pin-like site-specific DNA recombinase
MESPRVALYLRKSTDEQSMASQRLELQSYCDRQGWIPAIYEDTAGGGLGVTKHNLERLLAEIRAGRVDIVVVTKLDRLGRSQTHLAFILEEFRAHGVGLIAASQGIDTRAANPMGSLMLGVLIAVSEFELTLIRERTKAGMAAARAAGKHIGRPPVPQEVRSRVMAAAAVSGHKVRKIARELDMAPSTVCRLLQAAS